VKQLIFGLAALAVLSVGARQAHADFMFTGSAPSSDGPVSAEAYFVLGNGTITLYLANLTSGLQGQGQAISGITFTVSAPPNTSLSLTSAAGDVTTLTNGTLSSPAYTTFAASGGIAANWAAQTNNNVTDIGNPSDPHYLILGPNASFSGNGGTNFNPYFESMATSAENLSTASQDDSVVFVLDAPGLLSGSTISNVVFNFGTSLPEHTANGVPNGPGPNVAVPEPASLTLLGVGAFALFGYTWRRRKAA
jgi:hypothetical protein